MTSHPTHLKTSFAPISTPGTTILILGSLPGDRSIELKEYYGHARNNFWKIIATITNHKFPSTYAEKLTLLAATNIGLWDVAHKANRHGSLDTAIKDEEPNDLENFISRHPSLRTIGLNGTKAEKLFDKYFKRQQAFNYVSLPSSSPANTRFNFEMLCRLWSRILPGTGKQLESRHAGFN